MFFVPTWTKLRLVHALIFLCRQVRFSFPRHQFINRHCRAYGINRGCWNTWSSKLAPSKRSNQIQGVQFIALRLRLGRWFQPGLRGKFRQAYGGRAVSYYENPVLPDWHLTGVSDFCLRQKLQTVSVTHPASSPKSKLSFDSFVMGKATGTWIWPLALRLMSSSRRGV
jgi:hypothetical protein